MKNCALKFDGLEGVFVLKEETYLTLPG